MVSVQTRARAAAASEGHPSGYFRRPLFGSGDEFGEYGKKKQTMRSTSLNLSMSRLPGKCGSFFESFSA